MSALDKIVAFAVAQERLEVATSAHHAANDAYLAAEAEFREAWDALTSAEQARANSIFALDS